MTQYRRSQGEYMTTPSRFVDDVPEDVLEPVQLVEEDAPDAVEAPDEPAALPENGEASSGDAPPPERPNRDPTDADELPF
jgi:DNA helicase-2/ATP-dependent DNA helicase PcrA